MITDAMGVALVHVDVYARMVAQTVVRDPAQVRAKAIAKDHVKDLVQVAAMDIATNLTKQTGRSWQAGLAKNITFIVTKDCQLACKYCYLVGKNEKEGSSRNSGAFVKTRRIEC